MLLIKVGGGAVNQQGVVKDIKSLNSNSARRGVVFVHGASKARDELAARLGHPTKRITSPNGMVSVLTDREALDILVMAYSFANKRWVEVFQENGINAVGLSGADGMLWQGVRKKHLIVRENGRERLIRDTWTGKVEKINARLIQFLVESGYLPVLTQPAISSEGLINTDNDRNLAVMARELGERELVVLFEARGMLKDIDDENSLIREIKKEDLPRMLDFAEGTMKKKILGAQEAFQAGVKTIYWGDSRAKHPIRDALAGRGTVIR